MNRHHTRLTIVTAAAVAAAVTLVPLAYAQDGTAPQLTGAAEVTITSSNIGTYVKKSATTPVLMDFSTSWCQYCKVLNPILKRYAASNNGAWILGHIDGDQEKNGLNKRYNVSAYPTVVVLAGGKEVSGARLGKWPGDEGKVKTWLNNALKAAKASLKLPSGGTKPPSKPKPTKTSKPKPAPSKPAPAPTGGTGTDPTWPGLPAPMTSGKFIGAINVTSGNHADFMKASKERLVLIDFSKEGCGPCEALAPHLRAKNAADKDWVWGVLDGTEHQDLWVKYGNPWFPTMLAFRDGKEVARHVGFEGNFAEVKTWMDTLRSGKVPPSAETKMNITGEDSYARAVQLSKGKTIAVHFTKEPDGQVSSMLGTMAEADKGKWVHAVVNLGEAFAATMAQRLHTAAGTETITVLYEGRTWQKLLPNQPAAGATQDQLTAFIKKMTTTYYKPGTPEDGPAGGGSGSTGGGTFPVPTDGPTAPAPPGLPGGGQVPEIPAPPAPPSRPQGPLGILLAPLMMLFKLFGMGG